MCAPIRAVSFSRVGLRVPFLKQLGEYLGHDVFWDAIDSIVDSNTAAKRGIGGIEQRLVMRLADGQLLTSNGSQTIGDAHEIDRSSHRAARANIAMFAGSPRQLGGKFRNIAVDASDLGGDGDFLGLFLVTN